MPTRRDEELDEILAKRNLAEGGLIPHEYSVHCHTCKYSRNFAAARINAEIAAIRHKNQRQHEVGFYDHGYPIRTYTYSEPRLDW